MLITAEQVKTYADQGFLFLPEWFSEDEVEIMKSQLPAVFNEESPRRVVEKEGDTVRSVYGSHQTNEVFGRLSRHPRIVEPAMQILGGQVYVHQFKINAKLAFSGDVWKWHQDYVFWLKEDGMPAPSVINTVIFLDEITEFNGPLYLIPRSHREGVIEVAPNEQLSPGGSFKPAPYLDSPAWISSLTADLKYSLSREVVASLATRYGMVAPKGRQGSVLFFDSNIVHGSPSNISPFHRVLVLVTYNSISNPPTNIKNPRPEFLVSRNYEPIVPLSDNALNL